MAAECNARAPHERMRICGNLLAGLREKLRRVFTVLPKNALWR
jgi:hypothetical protein